MSSSAGRGDAGGHRHRSHGSALPLQEEGPGVISPSQDAEGVGMNGAHSAVMAEVPRSSSRRVELDALLGARVGLPLQDDDEPVHRVGVFGVPEKLSAPAAGDVAPFQGCLRVSGMTLHRFLAAPTEEWSLRASIASPLSARARRLPPSTWRSTARPSSSSRCGTSDSLDRFTPSSSPRWAGSIQGQSRAGRGRASLSSSASPAACGRRHRGPDRPR